MFSIHCHSCQPERQVDHQVVRSSGTTQRYVGPQLAHSWWGFSKARPLDPEPCYGVPIPPPHVSEGSVYLLVCTQARNIFVISHYAVSQVCAASLAARCLDAYVYLSLCVCPCVFVCARAHRPCSCPSCSQPSRWRDAPPSTMPHRGILQRYRTATPYRHAVPTYRTLPQSDPSVKTGRAADGSPASTTQAGSTMKWATPTLSSSTSATSRAAVAERDLAREVESAAGCGHLTKLVLKFTTASESDVQPSCEVRGVSSSWLCLLILVVGVWCFVSCVVGARSGRAQRGAWMGRLCVQRGATAAAAAAAAVAGWLAGLLVDW